MYKPKSKVRKVADKAAKRINKATGATKLAKYAGETIARRKNPTIKRTVTGKQAAKSAGKVAGTIGTLAAGGALAGVARVAKVAKAKKAASAAKRTQGHGKAFIKRTYSGHEKAGMNAAKKRNAAKRKKKG